MRKLDAHRTGYIVLVDLMHLLAVDEPSVRFFSPKNAVGVKLLGGFAGLQELGRLTFRTVVALTSVVDLARPRNDLVGAEAFEQYQDAGGQVLILGRETKISSMSLIRRHTHRNLEIAVLLLELPPGGQGVRLDHVVGFAERDPQDLVLTALGDGDGVGISREGPLLIVHFFAGEVIGKGKLLAIRRVDGEGREGDEKKEVFHGILKTLTQSICSGSGPNFGSM